MTIESLTIPAQFETWEDQAASLQMQMLNLPHGPAQILSPMAFLRPGHEVLHQTGAFAPTASLGNSPRADFIPAPVDPFDFFSQGINLNG